MNNKPINPNNRKAQKRDSKNIDADKILNLTLGELQEDLINSTLRVKGRDSFSPNYGLSKASSYSLFEFRNPTTPKEVVELKDNITNWLDTQNELNSEEPYNYLTFGAFKQWARSIINLLGKSGDSLLVGLYFCDSEGERIDTIKKGPLYNNDKYYFKFFQKNFDEVSDSEYKLKFLIPTINGLKGRDYTINVENSLEYLYSISINVLLYQPEDSSVELTLTYQETSYEIQTTLNIEIPEWSMLLVTKPTSGSSSLKDTYFSTNEISLVNLDNSEGHETYYFILLHNCYYYNSIINKSDWIIEKQRLASGYVNYEIGVSITDLINYPILIGRDYFTVYSLTVDYFNPYNNFPLDLEGEDIVQLLNIEAKNLFNLDVAFSIKDVQTNLNLTGIVGAKHWSPVGTVLDFVIGSGPTRKVVGKQKTIEISSAINQPVSLMLELNYVLGDTLEDQYVNCYGSINENTEYLLIESDKPTTSFVSSNIEETEEPAIYKLDNLKVVKLNTSPTIDVTVPLYFAHLTEEEDKEFRETSETTDLEGWIINKYTSTSELPKFPIFKLNLKIKRTEWGAWLKYPATSSSYVQPLDITKLNNVPAGTDFMFLLIPLELIQNGNEYYSEFLLFTTNTSSSAGSIYQGDAPAISSEDIQVESDGPFESIELKPQYRRVDHESGLNIYSYKAISKLNPKSFFKDNYKGYQDVTFIIRHDNNASNSNKVVIRFVPKDIIIYKLAKSEEIYRYVEIGSGNLEVVSFVDSLTKTGQEKLENFSNFSNPYTLEYQFLPMGTKGNVGCGDGLSLPLRMNSSAFSKIDHNYFYGLIELGMHFNNTNPSFYISSRFDDWLVGIFLNRPENSSSAPDFSYSPASLWGDYSNTGGAWGAFSSYLSSLNTSNDNHSQLLQFGPFYKSNFKNGKNKIEFLAYNNTGEALFLCALTMGGKIDRYNYNSKDWGYNNNLTK